MKGLLLVLTALAMGGSAYFIIWSKDPAPPVADDARGSESDHKSPIPLTGSPAERVSPAAGKAPNVTAKGEGTNQVAPGPIPRGATAESMAQEIFEGAKDIDLPVEQRLDRVRRYIADASRLLTKDEVANELVQLLDPNLDHSENGTFRAGVLSSFKGLKSEVLISPLLEGVEDNRTKVRLGALTSLVDYQTEESVRARVKGLLRDTDAGVRAKAKALLAMDPQAVDESKPDKKRGKRR